MRYTAVLLLLLLTFTYCSGSSDFNEIVRDCSANASLLLCVQDTSCRARFYLDTFTSPYREAYYRYLYLNILLPRIQLNNSFVVQQIISSDAPSSELSESLCITQLAGVAPVDFLQVPWNSVQYKGAREWLLAVLRQADFCADNEIFVIEQQKCQCKPGGKVCNIDPPGSLTFPVYGFHLMVIVTTIWILIRIADFLREGRTYFVKITEVNSQVKTLSQFM